MWEGRSNERAIYNLRGVTVGDSAERSVTDRPDSRTSGFVVVLLPREPTGKC